MCSISGSPRLDKAFDLYVNGLERGHHSSGALIMLRDSCVVLKQQRPFTKQDIEKELNEDDDITYVALHSRAPTNIVQREWQYEETHPFNFDTYYVAHNGIINNFKTFPESAEFEIDSSIIPYHLHVNNGSIEKTYSKYTGLLTSWIVDNTEHNFYLVKAGSSLFKDKDSFSSVQFTDGECVEKDGVIFKYTGSELQKISDFDYDNPYFIL
jgi:predicted glutamine amidotransferase